MKVLAILLTLACIQTGLELAWALRSKTNYFLSDYFRIVEVSLLCIVFVTSSRLKGNRRYLIVLGCVFAVVWAVNLIFFDDTNRMNSLMGMVSRAFMMAMAALVLWSQLHDERLPMTEQPLFWVASGVILYAVSTIAILGLSNTLIQLGRPYFYVAWHINWIMSIVANIFYVKGMLCSVPVPK